MKIRPVGAELFRADRRTSMTKLLVTFRITRTRPTTPRQSQEQTAGLYLQLGHIIADFSTFYITFQRLTLP